MFRTALFTVLAALAAAPVLAETVYVDDTLRVGVRRNANSTETPLKVVITGAKLEVLERGNDYLRVRTPDGVEGWVGAMYVTSTPPARYQLEQLRTENAQLKEKLASRQADAAAEVTTPLVQELETLRSQYQAMQSEYTNQRGSSLAGWVSAALLIALFVGGFFLGKRHERERVVRRFNGLEI
jgi:SH3 domain protein